MVSDSLGRHMRAEIREQASITERWASSNGYFNTAQLRWLEEMQLSAVLTFARGTSENAAAWGRNLMSQYAEMLCVQTRISEWTVLDYLPLVPNSLAIGISQSGQSPDLAAVARGYLDRGIPVLGIVNDPQSPLANVCDSVVDIAVGTEHAVAATKSFLAQCLVMLDLVDSLNRQVISRVNISEAVSRACDVSQEDGIQAASAIILKALTEHAGLVVTTRGPDFAMAREGALKIIETSGFPVTVLTTANLVHGPVAVIGQQTAVVVIVPDDPFRASVLATAEKLLERTSRLITVGTGTVTGSCLHIPLHAKDPQALSMAFAVWLQRLTLDLARGLGSDPDAPHGLEKVTRTL